MDSIKLGKHEFDITDISLNARHHAVKMWNKTHGIETDKDGNAKKNDKGEIIINKRNVTEKKFTNEVYDIGLFLLRQEFIVLNRKFPFMQAVREFIKRQLITKAYIKTLSEKNVEDFVSWIYFVMTGKKKATAYLEAEIITALNKMMENKTEKEASQFTKFVLTSLLELGGKWNTLKPTQKEKY